MTANVANTTLTTNFNVSPYYDDYEENKGYYRTLFKPGYAVQARELTQIQTTLQKQIDRFGKHIFREGSIVIPGNFDFAMSGSVHGPIDYVKIKDNDNSNNAVVIENFLDKEVTGLTTGIKGVISFVLDGTESSSNTKTIYVDYITASNTDPDIKTFQPMKFFQQVKELSSYMTPLPLVKLLHFIYQRGYFMQKNTLYNSQLQE